MKLDDFFLNKKFSKSLGNLKIPWILGGRRAGFKFASGDVPSAITLTALSDTSIKVDWTINATTHEGHKVYISTDNVTFTLAATVTGSTSTATIAGLTAGVLYYVRVCAYRGSINSDFSAVQKGNILPQKLILGSPAFFDDLETTTGWNPTKCTIAENTTEVYSGSKSIKLTSNGIDTSCNIYRSQTLSNNLDYKNVRIAVYVHSALTTFSNIQLTFFNDTLTKYFKYQYNVDANYFEVGKWIILGGYSSTSSSTAPTYDEITRFRILISGTGETPAVISFDALSWGQNEQPVAMIAFDDGGKTDILYALPVVQEKEMVATSYVISDLIDTANYMTSDDLIELDSEGWVVANHTKTHPNLTTLTQEQVEAEITGCKNFLDGLGITKGGLHIAYPGHYWNETVINALINLSAKSGRTAWVSNVYDTGGWPYKLTCHAVAYGDDVSVATNVIDRELGKKQPILILFHTVSPSEYPITSFSAILDYLKSKGVITLTIDEYIRLHAGRILINHK